MQELHIFLLQMHDASKICREEVELKSHPFWYRSECNAKNALKGDFRALPCRIKFVLIQSAWQKVVSPQALHAIKRIRFFDQGDSAEQLARRVTQVAPLEETRLWRLIFHRLAIYIKFIIMHRAQGNLFRKPSSPAGEPSFFRRGKRRIARRATNTHTPTATHFSVI